MLHEREQVIRCQELSRSEHEKSRMVVVGTCTSVLYIPQCDLENYRNGIGFVLGIAMAAACVFSASYLLFA